MESVGGERKRDVHMDTHRQLCICSAPGGERCWRCTRDCPKVIFKTEMHEINGSGGYQQIFELIFK